MYSTQGCHTATGTHMPHGITQCYLPPGRADIPALTPAEAGTRLSCGTVVISYSGDFFHLLSLSVTEADDGEQLGGPLEQVSCERNNGKCSPHAKCVPTPVGRVCLCKPGFVGDGFTCTAGWKLCPFVQKFLFKLLSDITSSVHFVLYFTNNV